MAAYSMDLRRRVLEACNDELESRQETAERFGVSLSFVVKLLRRWRETGQVRAKAHAGGRRRSLDEQAIGVLEELVGQRADATLDELG